VTLMVASWEGGDAMYDEDEENSSQKAYYHIVKFLYNRAVSRRASITREI